MKRENSGNVWGSPSWGLSGRVSPRPGRTPPKPGSTASFRTSCGVFFSLYQRLRLCSLTSATPHQQQQEPITVLGTPWVKSLPGCCDKTRAHTWKRSLAAQWSLSVSVTYFLKCFKVHWTVFESHEWVNNTPIYYWIVLLIMSGFEIKPVAEPEIPLCCARPRC